MNREMLQEYIYNELLIARLYQQTASQTPNKETRDTLLEFSKEAASNSEVLNQIHRNEFGTSYNAIVPETVVQGGYKGLLYELLRMELSSATKLRNSSYNVSNAGYKDTLMRMSSNKYDNIIILLAILTNLNTIEIDNLKDKS